MMRGRTGAGRAIIIWIAGNGEQDANERRCSWYQSHERDDQHDDAE
jgi:hypothetical protein